MTNKENLFTLISITEQCCYSSCKSNMRLFFLLEPTFKLYKNVTRNSQCLSTKCRKILYQHCRAFCMKKKSMQKEGATTLEIISKLFHYPLYLICSEQFLQERNDSKESSSVIIQIYIQIELNIWVILESNQELETDIGC